MSKPAKTTPLRQQRKELTSVNSDPRSLIGEEARKAVRAGLERMAKQHSAAESSTAHYRLR